MTTAGVVNEELARIQEGIGCLSSAKHLAVNSPGGEKLDKGAFAALGDFLLEGGAVELNGARVRADNQRKAHDREVGEHVRRDAHLLIVCLNLKVGG